MDVVLRLFGQQLFPRRRMKSELQHGWEVLKVLTKRRKLIWLDATESSGSLTNGSCGETVLAQQLHKIPTCLPDVWAHLQWVGRDVGIDVGIYWDRVFLCFYLGIVSIQSPHLDWPFWLFDQFTKVKFTPVFNVSAHWGRALVIQRKTMCFQQLFVDLPLMFLFV